MAILTSMKKQLLLSDIQEFSETTNINNSKFQNKYQ